MSKTWTGTTTTANDSKTIMLNMVLKNKNDAKFHSGKWSVHVWDDGYKVQFKDGADRFCATYEGKCAERIDHSLLVGKECWWSMLVGNGRPKAPIEMPLPLARRVAAYVRKHYVWED